MSKNDFKALHNELDATRGALDNTNKVLDKIVEWLEDEINKGELFADAYYKVENGVDRNKALADLDPSGQGGGYIGFGRQAGAEDLLIKIRRWEVGDSNKLPLIGSEAIVDQLDHVPLEKFDDALIEIMQVFAEQREDREDRTYEEGGDE